MLPSPFETSSIGWIHIKSHILAFLANDGDKSVWIMVTIKPLLRQTALRGKISYRFRESEIVFFLVIHYNYWCISPNYKVIQHFRLGFPYWSSFGDFLNPLKLISTLRISKRHILTPNHVFWAIICQNPLLIVVCDETRRKSKKKLESGKCVSHPHGKLLLQNRSVLNLTIIFISPTLCVRSKFGISIWLWRGAKFALSHMNKQLILTTCGRCRACRWYQLETFL